MQHAFQTRWDLRAAEAQVRAAERVVSAAHAERLPFQSRSMPSYGVLLGANPIHTHGVFAVTGSVNMPIWLGGRVKADIQQAEATLHQRQAELADQRGQVEQEVRTSLIDLETALGQIQLAQSNRSYAAETLREARDRFNLGVGTTAWRSCRRSEQVASWLESDFVSSTLCARPWPASPFPAKRRGRCRNCAARSAESEPPMNPTQNVETPGTSPAPRQPAVPPAPARPKGRRRAFLIFFLVLLIAAGGGHLLWLNSRNFESTDDAQ